MHIHIYTYIYIYKYIYIVFSQQWTAAARLLQARKRLRKAAPTHAARCACFFERWHVPLDLDAVRELPSSVKLQVSMLQCVVVRCRIV